MGRPCTGETLQHRARVVIVGSLAPMCGRSVLWLTLVFTSTNTMRPKCPLSGTRGSPISARIHQPRTRLCRRIHLPGNLSEFFIAEHWRLFADPNDIAVRGELDRNKRGLSTIQYSSPEDQFLGSSHCTTRKRFGINGTVVMFSNSYLLHTFFDLQTSCKTTRDYSTTTARAPIAKAWPRNKGNAFSRPNLVQLIRFTQLIYGWFGITLGAMVATRPDAAPQSLFQPTALFVCRLLVFHLHLLAYLRPKIMKLAVLIAAFLLPAVSFATTPSPLRADDGRDLSFLLKRYDGPVPILRRAVKGKRHIVPRTLQVENVPIRRAPNGLVERQQCDAGFVACPNGTQCCPAGATCEPGSCCPAGSLRCTGNCKDHSHSSSIPPLTQSFFFRLLRCRGRLLPKRWVLPIWSGKQVHSSDSTHFSFVVPQVCFTSGAEVGCCPRGQRCTSISGE